MTLSQIRRQIDALMRRFANEIAIIELEPIAEAVSNEWDPSEPPEPHDVIGRIADAGFQFSTFTRLSRYLKDVRRKGDVPEPDEIVLRLLPWAGEDRYRNFFNWDLPAPAR